MRDSGGGSCLDADRGDCCAAVETDLLTGGAGLDEPAEGRVDTRLTEAARFIWDLRPPAHNNTPSRSSPFAMPQFEQLILSAPQGFINTSLHLNSLALEENDKLETLVATAWQQVLTGGTSTSDEVKAIGFVIRSMKQAQPSSSLSQTANVLASTTVLSKECIEKILVKVKELSASEQTEKIEQAIHVSHPYVPGPPLTAVSASGQAEQPEVAHRRGAELQPLQEHLRPVHHPELRCDGPQGRALSGVAGAELRSVQGTAPDPLPLCPMSSTH